MTGTSPCCAPRGAIILALAIGAAAAPAFADAPLQAAWVDEAEQRVAEHRKTDVRIIVLDAAGAPVEGATVHIDQQRHDFPLGFTIGDTGDWPESLAGIDGDDPFQLTDAPLWRCFNAVALDGTGDWVRTSPEPVAEPRFDDLDQLTALAQRAGFAVHFGGVISADLGRNPDWLSELLEAGDGDGALAAALDRRVRQVMRQAPAPITHVDLYTHALDHGLIEHHFGDGGLRRLFERARALNPSVTLGIRMRDALIGARRHALGRRILALRDAFVPIDAVAIEQRISQQVIQVQLHQSLAQLEAMGVDVLLVGVELGGHGEAAAAYNAEIVLRTAFASPAVRGIWLGSVDAGEQTRTPHAALLDDAGEPTAPGRVIDRLFRQTWWTEHEATTDTLGNVPARIFTGVHRITVTWPDGSQRTTDVHMAHDARERVVVMER